VVDFQPPNVEDDTPLTPPGPEMRKVLEGGAVLNNSTTVKKEEEEEEGKSNNLKEIKEDLKAPELEVEAKTEEPKAELKKEGSKRVSFKEAVKEEIIVEEKIIALPKEEEAEEAVEEEPKVEVNEENEESVKEESKEVEATVDRNSKNDNNDDDDIARAAPVVVSFSEENPVEIHEDTIDDEDDSPPTIVEKDNAPPPPPPPPEAPVVAATTTESVKIEESSSGESEESSSSSSSGETESSEDTEEEEEEEENVAPYVAAAAVGAAAAGGAAAAAASPANEEEEEGDPSTETEAANDGPPESSLEENDFSNPEEETGEQFNLANEEHRNEVVPPQDQDEEQGLQLDTDDTVAAGAPLSPIAEKSVETNDPSFASAATATKAAEVANSTNDEEQQRRVLSSRKSSCCKRHKCLTLFIILMVLFVIAAAVLIILFFFGPLKHPTSDVSSRKGTPGLCDVWDLGPFYQTECETCSHIVAMDGDTGLIARGGEGRDDESIQFLTNFGTYLPLQTLPFISHEASALLGNYAALGDPNADGLGTVYIYERDSAGVWSDVWNITPETLNGEEAKFGTAIVLNADKMVVGAPGDANEASTGSVYVFGRGDDGNWVEEAKLYQPNVTTGNFGSAVALHGDTLVVADASFPGTVYVYQYDSTTNSWAQPIDGTLTSADCRSTFGISVGATDGGGVLIECPKDTRGAGAVYYYTPSSDGSGYELSQKITAFNEMPLPALGGKIVVDKDRLLVATDAKSVFVFELDVLGEWKEAASIAAPAGANNFGADAALFGEHIFLSYDGNTHSYILDC